jgi:hypothetical protein
MNNNIELVQADRYLSDNKCREISQYIKKSSASYGEMMENIKTLLHYEVERGNPFMIKRLTVLLESVEKIQAISYSVEAYYTR